MRPWLLGTGAVMLLMGMLLLPAWATGRFDGDWNVILSTKEGTCPKFYTFPVTIREGVIRGMLSGVKGRYEIQGRVAKDGRFAWGWGHSTGQLSEREGTGLWATTIGVRSGACAGDIALQRQP